MDLFKLNFPFLRQKTIVATDHDILSWRVIVAVHSDVSMCTCVYMLSQFRDQKTSPALNLKLVLSHACARLFRRVCLKRRVYIYICHWGVHLFLSEPVWPSGKALGW